MSRRGLPASRRRVEVPNSPLGEPLPRSEKSLLRHPGASFSGVELVSVGWPAIFGLVNVVRAVARCGRGGGRGRGSAASPASGRSEFPTGAAESYPKHHQFPTNAGRFSGISGKRWGVLRSFSGKPV